jgi:preprotein translocase subunit YajC
MFNPLVLLAQAQTPDGPPPWISFAPLIVIFALFYFLIILPAKRNEKRQREDLLSKLKKNDEVLTSAGIIGIVANIKDDEVTLKIDETSNAKLRVLKSSLVRIMNPKDPPPTTDTAQNIKAGAPSTK